MDNTSKLAYQALGYITSLTPLQAYALILGILFVCGMGVPIPEDIILMAAGLLAGQKKITFLGAVIVCFVGVLVGDTILFLVGQKYGRKVFKWPLVRRVFTEERIHASQTRIKKHAKKICFMARFMPGLRGAIFLTSGVMHVPFRTFILQDGLAALVSVPVWIYVGFLFSENFDAALKFAKRTNKGIIFVIIIMIIAYLFYQHGKNARVEKE